ncbi:PadR family transcriptional regulator [Paenibacillus profundus]|uniref:PadR family transcriptional regulator n=1 Tax=Paenibacillus profundus TaxID=1173085 RepID=A0ABS8YBK3_9BACL|nr:MULTISPECIES: PadR family transcriptional regulator [Paenibacillus]MCE5168827.1 PadR family transcriptional regulator [Paenibacillus profundus]MCM3338366.1 PadR family transcriptional regulator [Paenibacillus sp. MER TA 81-3]
MNVQFKKGALELCVLVLTYEQDRYGYELVHRISEKFLVAEGTMYPLLRRLTQEGYFSTYLKESPEGPSRKYYKLTETGETYMREMMAEWSRFSEGVDEIIMEVMKA